MQSTVELPPSHVFLALEGILEPRRPALRRKLSVAFVVMEGQRFLIDTVAPRLVSEGWRDDADVIVLTNAATLSDWVQGRFDPAAPEDHHVFMWGGDRKVWAALLTALAQTQSSLAAHLESLRR